MLYYEENKSTIKKTSFNFQNESFYDDNESLDMYGTYFNTHNNGSKSILNSFDKYMIEGEIEPILSEDEVSYLNNIFEKNLFDNILSPDNIFEDFISKKDPSPIYCFKPSIHETLNDILQQIKEEPKKIIQNNCLIDLGQDSYFCNIFLYKGTSGNLFLFSVDSDIRDYYLV